MTGWAMVGHWLYLVLVGLAAWSAVALLIAMSWHLIRRGR